MLRVKARDAFAARLLLKRRDPQLFIKGLNTFLNQLRTVKMHTVCGFMVYPTPEFLEFFFFKVIIQRIYFCPTVISNIRQPGIAVNAVNQLKYLILKRLKCLRQRRKGVIFYSINIGLGNMVILINVISTFWLLPPTVSS